MQQKLSDFVAEVKKDRMAGARAAKKPRIPYVVQGIGTQEATNGPLPPLAMDRLAQMPLRFQKAYLKALRGKSMKSAIKAFCLECVCWEREAVRLCSDQACPLYPYRPYRSAKE